MASEARADAIAEPVSAVVASLEIGLSDRADPSDVHDEVPLPRRDTIVESFTDEFDAGIGDWGRWDPSQPEWPVAWAARGGRWHARVRRLRDQRETAIALLRVVLLHPSAWRDQGGWHGSIDNDWVRSKIARCGLSIADSSLALYVTTLRATGAIDPPTRNRARRCRIRS